MPKKKKPQSLSSSSLTPVSKTSEEDISRSLLEEASLKYPHLISNSSFIGRITLVDNSNSSETHDTKIWLSEPDLVTFSLQRGWIVSVSLASSRKILFSGCPLDSFTDISDDEDHGAGNYFALAVVRADSKLQKNEVRLSWNLSHTMGNPDPGKMLFVSSTSRLSLLKCKDLYLELVPANNRSAASDNMLSSTSTPSKVHQEKSKNGKILSPKTPLRIRYRESDSNVSHSNETVFNTCNIGETLQDKDVKDFWEKYIPLWLKDRVLLHGNNVAFLRGGYTVFRVDGVDTLSTQSSDAHDFLTSGPLSYGVDDVAFVIDTRTIVHLNLSSISETETDRRCSSSVKLESIDINDEDEGASCLPKLGGLSKEFSDLKEIISSSAKDTLSSTDLRSIKGVLLHGPPGTGKTSLALSCVNDLGFNLFSIKGPEIISQFHGESEQALHEVFDSASRAVPAVVFIDELDAIAPARKDGGNELSQRMVATLLNLMDGIGRTHGVVVIAATNRPDSIDPALRRPGRLDREIEIGVPSPKQRLDILHTIFSKIDHSLTDIQVQNLASSTHGFVGADLVALCNEAAFFCLRRYIMSKKSSPITRNEGHIKESFFGYDDCSNDIVEGSDVTVSLETAESVLLNSENQQIGADNFSSEEVDTGTVKEALIKVTFDDFEKAKAKVRPSAMREVILEIPKVNWEDVGGQKEVKEQLMEAVEWPQKNQDAFKNIGTRPPTGVLMFGPPGCSKTLMARAVASEAGLNFLAVKGPELFSKWVGESEKAVKSVFAKARVNAPSIIFFDEIDGLAGIRGKENDGVSVSDRVMSQLLVELNGLHQRVDVTVIAATNRPDKIDSALLRPGRFDRLLYVGPPNVVDREEIFRIHVRKKPCSADVNLRELAHLTEGCTGADISSICREAANAAMEESLDASEVTMAHFKIGVASVQPSEVQSYEKFCTKFQRLVCSGATVENVAFQPKSSSSSLADFW
ncbi:hypothetical protein GIB67_006196 [Kingdonia uniflora]|uniref:AAA+ ATPase domain-containing protein n=1 Tax=Kingdonia uniflora TaxID=39325 RepID=A0A7J7LQC3_9MAGN|nr:hypothetical protein GIB67_006196 [Kingdonia uniflora]